MRLLEGGLKRALDAHGALSAIVAERAHVEARGTGVRGFDALWSGSLSCSTVAGLADTGITPLDWRLVLIEQMRRVSTLPILFDAENGGAIGELPSMVRKLEQMGVNAIVIEDRFGPKSNSFAQNPSDELAGLYNFSTVLKRASQARRAEETMIIGRLEGLVFGLTPREVAERALAIEDAGIGAILIHSKSASPANVLEAALRYRSAGGRLPLVAVPTSYASVTEGELETAGFSLVVYANQLLRGAMRAMSAVAERILTDASAHGAEQYLLPVDDLLGLFPPDANAPR
jgi:2-methylisocitrate lyase-like PEP mutase family enzyme